MRWLWLIFTFLWALVRNQWGLAAKNLALRQQVTTRQSPVMSKPAMNWSGQAHTWRTASSLRPQAGVDSVAWKRQSKSETVMSTLAGKGWLRGVTATPP